MSKIEFNANARIYQGEFRRNVQVEPSAACLIAAGDAGREHTAGRHVGGGAGGHFEGI